MPLCPLVPGHQGLAALRLSALWHNEEPILTSRGLQEVRCRSQPLNAQRDRALHRHRPERIHGDIGPFHQAREQRRWRLIIELVVRQRRPIQPRHEHVLVPHTHRCRQTGHPRGECFRGQRRRPERKPLPLAQRLARANVLRRAEGEAYSASIRVFRGSASSSLSIAAIAARVRNMVISPMVPSVRARVVYQFR